MMEPETFEKQNKKVTKILSDNFLSFLILLLEIGRFCIEENAQKTSDTNK